MNNPTQSPLFNYQQLTSTKAMKALHRARRAAIPASTSSVDGSEKITTLPNQSRVQRAAVSTQLPNDSARRWSNSEQEPEFNIVGEDRVLTVLHHFKHCSICGCKPCLERRNGEFKVGCYPYGSHYKGITHRGPCKETPWLPSSKEAVQYWRVIAALEK